MTSFTMFYLQKPKSIYFYTKYSPVQISRTCIRRIPGLSKPGKQFVEMQGLSRISRPVRTLSIYMAHLKGKMSLYTSIGHNLHPSLRDFCACLHKDSKPCCGAKKPDCLIVLVINHNKYT